MKPRNLAVSLFVSLWVGWSAAAALPEYFAELEFQNLASPLTTDDGSPAYGFGLDATALDGYDSFDSFVPPDSPVPQNPNGGKMGLIPVELPPGVSGFAKDVHKFSTDVVQNYYWRLDIEVNHVDYPVTMSWSSAEIAAWDLGYEADFEIRQQPDGAVLADMTAVQQYTFTSDSVVYIVVAADEAAFPPVARADTARVFLGYAVEIPVLDNDDPAGATILSLDTGDGLLGDASVAIDGNLVVYTAPTTHESADWPVTDEFSYTMQNAIGETATATVQVRVFGEVFGIRDHTGMAKTGEDGGLNVQLWLLGAPGVTMLRYTEFLPGHLTGGGRAGTGWVPVTDGEGNIVVTLGEGTPAPDTMSFDSTSGELRFEWDLSGRADGFDYSLSYDIVNSDPDALGDTQFSQGSLVYSMNAGAEEVFEISRTEFEAVDQLFHSADYENDGNWAISLTELLRVISYYNAGGYKTDEDNGKDNFAPGAGPITRGHHSADYENGGNGAISLTELLRVISYYNAGGYHTDPGNGKDDYAPGAPTE